MIVMKFDGATIAGAPRDWDQELDGTVEGLPILPQVDLQSGLTFLYSVWRPDADELAMLIAGGALRLGIGMPRHPIVNMAVLLPETVVSANCRDHIDFGAAPTPENKSG